MLRNRSHEHVSAVRTKIPRIRCQIVKFSFDLHHGPAGCNNVLNLCGYIKIVRAIPGSAWDGRIQSGYKVGQPALKDYQLVLDTQRIVLTVFSGTEYNFPVHSNGANFKHRGSN